MTAFTKGPWRVANYEHCLAIECEVDGIAHTVVMDQFCYPNFQQNQSEEKQANARLISAAPEMYELLESIVNDEYPPLEQIRNIATALFTRINNR